MYEIHGCTNMITALVSISENLSLVTKQKADCKLFSHQNILPLNYLQYVDVNFKSQRIKGSAYVGATLAVDINSPELNLLRLQVCFRNIQMFIWLILKEVKTRHMQ